MTKTEQTHTSGPWDVSKLGYVHKNGVMYPLAPDETRMPGESWLEMRERIKPELLANAAERRANARLIAAAPDLMKALKGSQILLCVALIEAQKANDNEFCVRLKERLKMQAELIAKAGAS